ncbi:unnamed protein product [Adineta ricciae]|uniref:Aprataxin and PNK-like factor n=1 Tax=Adineta ricciae TaxID=249248 RepID=A0A815XMR7_ADIRI|nr:unnamed protein product [Adineta ricciae]
MSTIELIPLEKGNRLLLDGTSVTTIGRTPNIGCLDKKISRNHAELHVKSDGTLWIKPIHQNPTFYRTKSNQLITLTKDQEFELNDNDEIGLLPNEYFYRISIKSNEQEQVKEPSVTPKSPAQEKEPSPPKSNPKEKSPVKGPSVEPEGGIILHTTRALPAWMANGTTPERKSAKVPGKNTKTPTPTATTPSPSKHRTYIGRKKAEGVVYDDHDEDDDEEPSNNTATSQRASVATKPDRRERCPYGKFCYRKNPIHRKEAIHPGDPDWNDKENDTDDTKPECPYGSDCYRKNPDHFNEYSHTKKRSSMTNSNQRAPKRKAKDDDDDDEDDDDGLPNEYDYNDSFIDDEDLEDSALVDRAGDSQGAPDNDWKPHRKARHSDHDDEDVSTDASEIDLLKEEAAEFVQGTSINNSRSAKKKARVHMPKDNDDDDGSD